MSLLSGVNLIAKPIVFFVMKKKILLMEFTGSLKQEALLRVVKNGLIIPIGL
jgi:hypothetical protein